MVRIAIFTIMAAATVMALPQQLSARQDAAGSANVGNGAGRQFITGGCIADADCASTCCAPAANGGGTCAARLVAEGDGRGCGFGGAGAAAPQAPPAPPAPPANNGAPGGQNVGNGAGLQFITGQCLADADCASTCCAPAANGSGSCAARLVAEADGRGCGFGGAAVAAPQAPPPPPPAAPAADPNVPGSQNVGNGAGQQFITGQCLSDADCASTCCAPRANGGGSCAARLVAEADGRGCGFI
ncbi:hypothetical protein B0I35DRAFT_479912 [Stachybotrys elegans]|uniref:Biotrophy-associated secreted protein 2 n=1 Tax=Stachybotrys elegans TaxID=80388 RepID=A0A8K0WQ50_9HYPO|nr:hypothetical protein B0I35DRAFT_479912 [Stachybotrys elegans]